MNGSKKDETFPHKNKKLKVKTAADKGFFWKINYFG